MTNQDGSQVGTMRTIASLIGKADRGRYEEILEFLAKPARLLFDPAEAKRYSAQALAAREDLLAILRRTESRGDARVAELIRHFEGRGEGD